MTVHHCSVDLVVSLEWPITYLDALNYIATPQEHKLTWSPSWTPPVFDVLNSESGTDPVEIDTSKVRLKRSSDGTVTAVMELRAKGAFYELLELDDYPFDVQPLTISLQTARIWGSNLPKFVVARQQGDDQGKDPIVHPTDWAYCMCKASQEQTGEDSAECYVTLHFSLVVKRRSFVQVFRVIVANACFALVSCLGFTFPRSDAGERVALSVTMLLTGIPEAVVVFVKATDFRGNGFEGSEISISGKFHVTLISI